MTQPANSYDLVPYTSHPYAQTHPRRLATMATLFGMNPAGPDRCRVLELGCASGGNLIPMAVASPDSVFVGVELSQRQVAAGRETIAALGLKNIEIRQGSITEVGDADGTFDYIICHGVFSWVPSSVQDAILRACATRLTPNGVAYVSYNTLPGWHMYGMLRDMMLFHANRFTEPQQRVGQARALLDFLHKWAPGKDDAFGVLLKKFSEDIRTKTDDYLFHEHLEEVNEPLYFHQFIKRAVREKLQFLGEADLGMMASDVFPAEVQAKLQELAPNVLFMEQYMDFLRNRTFRQTLLCRDGQTLNRNLSPASFASFAIASSVRPTTTVSDLTNRDSVEFKGPSGAGITTNSPLIKVFLTLIGESWPLARPFSEVYQEAFRRLGRKGDFSLAADIAAQSKPTLEACQLVYSGVTRRLIEVSVSPPRFSLRVGPRPVASPLARLQAEKSGKVTNLRHELVVLRPYDVYLLKRLDGTRDWRTLLEESVASAANQDLVLRDNDQVVTDPSKQREMLDVMLSRTLNGLARHALLLDQ